MINSVRTLADPLTCEYACLDIAGRRAFLIQSQGKPPRFPIPWVWYAPTLIGSLPDSHHRWMFSQFLANGIAVAGLDIGETWGNSRDCKTYSAFHEKLRIDYGLSKRPCLLAQSRGSLILYNWAAENPDQVGCIAGIYPICDLRSFSRSNIQTVFHMSGAELDWFFRLHNPVDRLLPLARAGVPIFHLHGDSDEITPIAQNSLEPAKRYRRFGGTMEVHIVSGKGHEVGAEFFQSRRLVEFIIRYARQGSKIPLKPRHPKACLPG